jgi:DNA helicase-2/ATP-dependent DNA helicase PcrA
LDGFTVLYRTHAQSRAIEEAMIKYGFPYRVIGGVKFYQRREVKDILAYLRLALNPNDGISLARIYNVPNRGIGPASFEKLKEALDIDKGGGILSIAEKNGLDMGQRQLTAIRGLAKLVKELGVRSKETTPSALIRYIIKETGYESYINDKSEEGEARWENIKELFTATRKFDKLGPPEGLEKFLEEVALIQETDKLDNRERAIKLMTIHSAKGLEFSTVFVIGMEEGIFPHSRSLIDPRELEEERRLCYVAITRAKERLHLTFCRKRSLYGQNQLNSPSRFLFEIPEHLINFSPINDGETYDDFIEYY